MPEQRHFAPIAVIWRPRSPRYHARLHHDHAGAALVTTQAQAEARGAQPCHICWTPNGYRPEEES